MFEKFFDPLEAWSFVDKNQSLLKPRGRGKAVDPKGGERGIGRARTAEDARALAWISVFRHTTVRIPLKIPQGWLFPMMRFSADLNAFLSNGKPQQKEDRMNGSQNRMTYEECMEEHEATTQLRHMERRDFVHALVAIQPELDHALGAYMAALDNPQAKRVMLVRFDDAVRLLRKTFREHGYDWDHYVTDAYAFRALL
jgi:hypothetical protein